MFLHRIKLLALAGFMVWVDASWLILAALLTWTLALGEFPHIVPNLSTATYWWMGLAGAIGLFISIVLHELTHVLIARRYGVPIAGLSASKTPGTSTTGAAGAARPYQAAP